MRRGARPTRAAARPLMIENLRNLLFKDRRKPAEADDGPVTLAAALDRGWCELFYQPKIELKTKRLVGAEGLVRARHPVLGVLPPNAFLPGASEDEILALTERVIITALEDWEACAAYGLSLKFSVNVPVSALVKIAHSDHPARAAAARIQLAGAHHGSDGRRDHP